MSSKSERYKKYRFLKQQMAYFIKNDEDEKLQSSAGNIEIITEATDPEVKILQCNTESVTPQIINVNPCSSFDPNPDPDAATNSDGTFQANKNINKLQYFLRNWALDCKINHLQLTSLLKGLNNIFPDVNLPNDSRSLLKTSRSHNIRTLNENNVYGKFVYFGIKSTLQRYLTDKDIKAEVLKRPTLKLIINVDGIPISKSSNKQFWPILCKVHFENLILSPFPIAIYYGSSKPPSLNYYLEELIIELNELITNGFKYENIVIAMHVICFTCDAPARAFLKNIKGHNCRSGCERCIEEGVYFNRRIIYKDHNCQARTHTNFKNFDDVGHHRSNLPTPLLDIKGFNIINNFPLDYLHLCCLGITRKLMFYWCKKDCLGARRVLLSFCLRKRLSDRMIYYSKFIPSDFARKSRSINELDRFKATEFRLFLLYLGPIVLKDVLSQDLYDHFLLFHSAMRILLDRALFHQTKYMDLAKKMLNKFVTKFSTFYGKESCIYNVHSLVHLTDDRKYGNDTG